MVDQVMVGLGVLWGLVWLLSYWQRRRKTRQDDSRSCERLLQFLMENRARFPHLLSSNINIVLGEFSHQFRGVDAEQLRLSDMHTFAAQLEVQLEQRKFRQQTTSDPQQISEQES